MAYAPFLPRTLVSAITILALAACSSSDLAPPAGLSSGAELIGPIEGVAAETSYAAPENPVSRTAGAVDYLNTPNLAGASSADGGSHTLDQQALDLNPPPGIHSGASMANPLGLGSVPLDDQMIAEGNTSQPIVAGIGTDQLVQQNGQANGDDILWQGQPMDVGQVQQPMPAQPEPQQVAFVPRFQSPESTPQSFGGMPVSEKSCRDQLRRLGGKFTELPPINDSKSCRIDFPIKLEYVSGDIDVKPDATLNCQMALTFAKWVKSEVEPAARLRYLSGVKSIRQLSSYSCRRMNSSSNNPWSEHASGNAIDIGEIALKNGKEIDVRKKSFFAFREKGLLKAVRTDSCKYFNTVLGPGSDRHHKDHFHFDLRARNSGKRYCSL